MPGLRQRYAAGSRIVRIALVVSVVLAGGWWLTKSLISSSRSANESLIYYDVRRQDLSITVTERGNLESQDNEKICRFIR